MGRWERIVGKRKGVKEYRAEKKIMNDNVSMKWTWYPLQEIHYLILNVTVVALI
jgi:hypothetical protein